LHQKSFYGRALPRPAGGAYSAYRREGEGGEGWGRREGGKVGPPRID